MEADVLVISILIGLMLFLAVISIATILYQKNSKNTRYQKEHPDDWLFHDFNHKMYSAVSVSYTHLDVYKRQPRNQQFYGTWTKYRVQ